MLYSFFILALALLEAPQAPGPIRLVHTTFGAAIAAGPDLDGDGAAEFFVSSPAHGFSGTEFRPHGELGAVWCFSGKSGALLWRVTSPSADDGFGQALAVPLQPFGDPAVVLLVGASTTRPGHTGRVYGVGAGGQIEVVYRAPRGSQQFGSKLSQPLDIEGDGALEFLSVSGPRDADSAQVVLVSCDTGEELAAYGRVTNSPYGHGQFGWCPPSSSDRAANVFTLSRMVDERRRLTSFDPATGEVVLAEEVEGLSGCHSIFQSQTGVCDALLARTRNGIRSMLFDRRIAVSILTDEITDVAVLGSHRIAVGEGGWGISSGRVTVFDTRDSASADEPMILESGKPSTWHFGDRIRRLDDVDDDGDDDLLVAEDNMLARGNGRVWVFSGKECVPLYSIELTAELDLVIEAGKPGD